MNPHSLNWKHRVLITGQLGKFHLFYNCKFVLNPLHMFRPALHGFVNHQFDLSVSLFWIYFVCSFVLFFRFHIKEKSFSICLSVWVTFRIIFSRSTHVVANDKISFFLWQNNIPLYICMHVYIYILIHSSADGHLGCFHVFAIVSMGPLNIGLHVFF